MRWAIGTRRPTSAKDLRAALDRERDHFFATNCRDDNPERGDVSRQVEVATKAVCDMALSIGAPGALLNIGIAGHGASGHGASGPIPGVASRFSISIDEVDVATVGAPPTEPPAPAMSATLGAAPPGAPAPPKRATR